jgi:outer membrane autotransporter protein
VRFNRGPNRIASRRSANGVVPFRSDLGGTWFEINIGASGQIGQSTSLFANVSYETRFKANSYAYNGKIGLRITW